MVPQGLQDSRRNVFPDFCITVSCSETSSSEAQGEGQKSWGGGGVGGKH